MTKKQPGQMYKLEYGKAKWAEFEVLNAPRDARVAVDFGKGPVVVGTAANPLPYGPMEAPVQRATVTIGDRKLSIELKAGSVNKLDYAQATP